MTPVRSIRYPRRHWLALVGGASLSAAVSAGQAHGTRAAASRELIDFHTHLAPDWAGSDHKSISAADLLRWMDRRGVARAVALPLVSPEAFWYPVTTDYVLAETRPHRDRLIPFCAIDPRTLETHLATPQQAVDLLKRYRDAGARGFGEHKPKLPIDDPLNMRLYEACAAVSLPILLHLDNYANMDEPGLPGFSRVLAAFPDLPFIGHGKGWWASISGGIGQADLQVGYPHGPIIPGGAIDDLMTRHANLYGDLSSSGAHALLRDRPFGREFLRRRADRLVFGTDYYEQSQTSFQQFDLLDELEAPADVRRQVEHATAERLLALSA